MAASRRSLRRRQPPGLQEQRGQLVLFNVVQADQRGRISAVVLIVEKPLRRRFDQHRLASQPAAQGQDVYVGLSWSPRGHPAQKRPGEVLLADGEPQASLPEVSSTSGSASARRRTVAMSIMVARW